MDTVLSHFSKQNEIKQCPFKIKFGGVSRQTKSRGLFTQPLKKLFGGLRRQIVFETASLKTLFRR